MWLGNKHDQYEVFFVARALHTHINAPQPDSYVIGHKWWRLSELARSPERFAPTGIATLLAPILTGEFPDEPFDCGI